MRDLGRSGRLEEAAQKAGVREKLDLRRLDVTEFDSLPGAIAGIVHDHGRIDVLVNNAGFSVAGFVEDLQLSEIRHQFETNFFGNVAMSKAILPVMRQQKSGHIIQVASVAGRAGTTHAERLLLRPSSLSKDLANRSASRPIHSASVSSLVEPGAFDTDIWTRNVVVGKARSTPTLPTRNAASASPSS